MRIELGRSQKIVYDYQNALDQSSIVAITDPAGLITYVNDKFCEISKYPRHELLGKSHKIINSKYHPKSFFTDLWATIAAGSVWRGEIKNRAKDGSEYWVDTTIVPFTDSEGKIDQYLSIRTDISDRKSAEALLEEDRARLVHAEKMASLGEMAAGIAHELGNPLASVSSWFDVVISQAESGNGDIEEIARVMPAAKEKISHMKNIIRGMLTYARDGSEDPFEKVSLLRIVVNVLEYCGHRLKKGDIEYEIDSGSESYEVECRETEISQVLVNLIANSCDAVKDLPERWIKLGLKKASDGVEVSLTDSGVGIPEEHRHLIMKPFFTTKPRGSGTGLGLSISNAIVSRHGGTLAIREEGPNTCFVMFLPYKHLNHDS